MKTVGVFFGSRSPEHDISILTAQVIMAGLRELGDYVVVPIYISKTGKWFIEKSLGSLGLFQKGEYRPPLSSEYVLDINASVSGSMVFCPKFFFKKKIVVDIAFPAFHGKNGEDGTIQGLFELLDIPYIGCDVASSANAMDKVTTKLLYQSRGLPTVPFVFFSKSDWGTKQKTIQGEILSRLCFPLFVKPARLGSSIGIAKVKTDKDLEFAIEVALHYDDKVLVENGVEHLKDITCAVIGNEVLTPSLLQESGFEEGFFTYEDKYLKGGGAQLGKAQEKICIPANLDNETTMRIQNMAMEVFTLLGCSGVARVDFLYDTEKKITYVNEVNTLPGTLYHHLWKKSGIELPELLRRLIGYGVERHKVKSQYISKFESSVLKQADWSQKLYFKGISGKKS